MHDKIERSLGIEEPVLTKV